MQHLRVLGTMGLITATVLGAVGPVGSSHAATQAATARPARHGKILSITAQMQKAELALQNGFVKTKHGRVYLSSALTNRIQGVGSTTSPSTRAAGSAHSSLSPNPQVRGAARANQDFGFYYTGNGQLFHNTESVAVDPQDPQHVVISATDTRAGSDGSIFNPASNPLISGNPSLQGNPAPTNDRCLVDTTTPFPTAPCGLSQALGGPGVYDSVDGAATFTDGLIPDMISGAVPNALNAFITDTFSTGGTPGVNGAAALVPAVGIATTPTGDPLSINSAVSCIQGDGSQGQAPLGIAGTGAGVPGVPTGCQPYDSVGDTTVAFDNVGNLYTASLGLVSLNGIPGAGPQGTSDFPQTDVVVNVSPAVQPVGQLLFGSGQAGLTANANTTTGVPDAAGRFFNAVQPHPLLVAANLVAAPSCDPSQPSTLLCLHNEVTASSYASNFVVDSSTQSSQPAAIIGRNFQADGFEYVGDNANNPLIGDTGPGVCGLYDLCLIDQPYLAINNLIDPTAYLTYTVIDFGPVDGPNSNIYLQTAQVPATEVNPFTGGVPTVNLGTGAITLRAPLAATGPGSGLLPRWTLPRTVDNAAANPFCPQAQLGCTDSWGAETAIGPDGAAYIAYENGDFNGFFPQPADGVGSNVTNAILVAQVNVGGSTINSTALAALALDHDVYEGGANFAPPLNGSPGAGSPAAVDPAGLDPASGAYFTIPNRPSIAVTTPVNIGINGSIKFVATGLVIVAWTDQRSLFYPSGTTFPNGIPTAQPNAIGLTGGTRIWYSVGATFSSQGFAFNILGTSFNGTSFFAGTKTIAQTLTVPNIAGQPTFVPPGFRTGLLGGLLNIPGVPLAVGAIPSYFMSEVYEPGTNSNQFFPAIAAAPELATVNGSTTGFSNIPSNLFIGFYQENNAGSTSANLAYYVAKSNDYGQSFGINQVATTMPLPNVPLSAQYCATAYGFTYGSSSGFAGGNAAGTPAFSSSTSAAAACNAVPYFGTYTGAASDNSNGAYFAWTDTRGSSRNFQVQGSQDVYATHVN